MRVNVLGDAGALCRHTASVPDDFVGNGSIHAVPIYDAWEYVRDRSHPAPVFAQSVQQFGAERHVAVASALAFADMHQHPFFIDVGGPQLHHFAAAHAGRVQDHQDRAIQQVGCRIDHPGYFLLAQNRRQAERDLRERDVLQHIVALERLHKQKTQRSRSLSNGVGG